MNEPKLAPRIFLCFVAASVVGFVAVFIWAPNPERITLGTLADKEGDHSYRSVLVSNVIGGKQHGRYLVIPSPRADRYAVVFELATDAPLPPVALTLRGTCHGVFTNQPADCPVTPPYIFIANAKPIHAN